MKTAEQLKRDVERELGWDPIVHAEQIGVSVKDGVVELDGHVSTFYEKWAAERDALRVADVMSVASEIQVDLPNLPARTDEDIARTAATQLEWNSLVPGTVKVQVTDGILTLKGAVEWQFQKNEAERAVRPLVGVKGVFNEIELRPTAGAANVKPESVKAEIEAALKRNAAIDAAGITVEARDNNVTLRGRVHSWTEREEAEHLAYAAPGVISVDNRLEIRP